MAKKRDQKALAKRAAGATAATGAAAGTVVAAAPSDKKDKPKAKTKPKTAPKAKPASKPKSKPKAKPKSKTNLSAVRNTPTSSVKTKGGDYSVYRKSSSTAGSFRKAYAAAKKGGKTTFSWQGRKYAVKDK